MTALLITLFLPLIGAILLLLAGNNTKIIKYTALGVSVVTFIVSLFLYFSFDQANPEFQFVFESVWITQFDAGFRIGIDGMSLLLVLLTTLISPIAILSSFDAIKKREKEYYFMVLILQFAMTGVFVALDLFLFYIFWEIILIPMYFIIGIWGGKNRIYAAVKFFIFTAVGSLFMLVAIVWVAHYAGTYITNHPGGFTSNYLVLRDITKMIPLDIQNWLFWAFALSFFIKVPLFPVHTWLPDAHTDAPTPGSVILASILLKMGTYGLIRFNLELFPVASIEFSSIISALAVIGIIYGALVAMIQTDFKRLVAYTSVSHLGFVVLGIFSMTLNGIQGAIIQMVNHGLSTGLLFLCVGFLYERRHTRLISEYGGVAKVMPHFSVIFGIAMFASIGLPGLNGFIGEFLTLQGAMQSKILNNPWFTVFGTSGVILAAVYLLWMYQRVMYGTIDNPQNLQLKDLKTSEYIMTIPLIIFIVWIGVYPNTFLNISDVSAKKTVNKIEMIKFNRQPYELPTMNNKIDNNNLENSK
ncbi:MAG TPA: NADH-quinone oxidoreductase subunit M [Candidatus Kapabacteria bacterium]|nr:NADH-quinone oxidoreductase subunit M [Candidatus Kapabacteria bacterium]